MRIKSLIKRINLKCDNILNNHHVTGISSNSKKIKKNYVFVAINGERQNGNDFIKEAILNGAETIITEEDVYLCDANYIKVEDARLYLALLLKCFYHDISKKLKIVGVTGTNGKTTITTLCYKYYLSRRQDTTLIGTNGIYIGLEFLKSSNTTPSIEIIYETLQKSYDKGIDKVFIEVSSHAIKMLRVYGITFKVVLLTNLSQDHLDYHENMFDYKYTKGVFLNKQTLKTKIIINSDIPEYRFFKRLSHEKAISYGANGVISYSNVKLSKSKSSFDLCIKNQKYTVETTLLGRYNVENAVAFICIIKELDKLDNKVFLFLNKNILINGRCEIVRKENKTVIIDFAHTPDGIKKILDFVNEIKTNKVIVVFGMGGNRDKSKRKEVGKIVSNNCDFAFVTSDNPRYENKQEIIENITAGFSNDNYKIVVERDKAIVEALTMQSENDIVVILGKGNEEFIQENGQLIPFSDKSFVTSYFSRGK